MDRPRYPLLLSCGEIETESWVETVKQSLFHRKLKEGHEKGGDPVRVTAFVTGGDIIH